MKQQTSTLRHKRAEVADLMKRILHALFITPSTQDWRYFDEAFNPDLELITPPGWSPSCSPGSFKKVSIMWKAHEHPRLRKQPTPTFRIIPAKLMGVDS